MIRKSTGELKTYDGPVEGNPLSPLITDDLRSQGPVREATLSPAIPGVPALGVWCVCWGGLRERTREQNTGFYIS